MHNDNQRENTNRDKFDDLRSNIERAKRSMNMESSSMLIAFDIIEALLLDFEKRLTAIEGETAR